MLLRALKRSIIVCCDIHTSGFFKVGDELTSGVADQKEGIYFGSELPADHPLPLHGPNQWPEGQLGAEMKDVVLEYLSVMQQLGIYCIIHVHTYMLDLLIQAQCEQLTV